MQFRAPKIACGFFEIEGLLVTQFFYVDPAVFEREKKRIFLDSWIFFCFLDQVSEEDSFLRKTLFNENVFVVNRGGQLSGFFNSCPHRFHPLVKTDSGQLNQMVCDYHRWSFKPDGRLANIPFCSEAYQFSRTQQEKISLNRFHVEVVGKFVFINLAEKPNKIGEQFSKELLGVLEEISDHVSSVHTVSFEKQFNWKLIQENLRDPLHPAFIHPKTLAKEIDAGLPGIPRDIPFWALPLKKASYGGPDVALLSTSPYRDHFLNPWPAEGRYHNYWLYPNSHLAAPDGGLTFVLENFVALSPGSTRVEIYYLVGENDFSPAQYEGFIDALTKSAMRVYDEDFEVLEAIQQVVGSYRLRFPMNGKFERMITRFHKIYLNKTKYWTKFLVAKLIKNKKEF